MPKNILPHGLHKTCWLLLLTVLLFLVTLSAPYWVPHDPYLQNLDLALQAPSAEYPFGTDRYGRCVFSRVLVGGQSSIFSALALVGQYAADGAVGDPGTRCGDFCDGQSVQSFR